MSAARGGHQAWAEALLDRGADISDVASGAARGRHLGNDKLIVRWLSHGTAQKPLGQWVKALCASSGFLYYKKRFPKQLLHQIQKNHALMRAPVLRGESRGELKFNYYESCLLTNANKQYAGGLFLLRAVLTLSYSEHLSQSIEPDVPFPTLPTELWLLILSMSFNLAPKPLVDFGKKLRLATQVALRSDIGYARLFSTSEHPFLQSGESKTQNEFCTVQ
jgi:hypothetical protein